MSTQVQFRRGTTAEHSTFAGASGELTVDTQKNTIVVHDGTTVGGKPIGPSFGTSSGANHSVSFANNGIHKADCSSGGTFTFTFDNPADVAKVDLILENLSDVVFDLGSASYDNVSFSISSQASNASGLEFSSDGTKMYTRGNSNSIVQYSLLTAWDISTASYQAATNIGSQAPASPNFKFSSDGTKMYASSITGGNLFQYSLSTAWNISTMSYDNVSFNVGSQDADPFGIEFSPDGLKMFILGVQGRRVYQYSLGTAWDISTASYDGIFFNVNSQDNLPYDITFSTDGTKMFMIGSTDRIYQYSLSTAWDIGSATYDNILFNVSSQDTFPIAMAFSSDETKMFMIGNTNDRVYQYTTASDIEIVMPNNLDWEPPQITHETLTLTIVTTDGGTSYKAINILHY